jgi:hypothetical protein
MHGFKKTHSEGGITGTGEPSGFWHDLANATILSLSISPKAPMTSMAVSPQYIPEIRRCSVIQYSKESSFCKFLGFVKTNSDKRIYEQIRLEFPRSFMAFYINPKLSLQKNKNAFGSFA